MSNLVKAFLKSIAIILGLLFMFSVILNVLYYFDVINNNLLKYFKMFVSVITFFIGGVYIGKHSSSKGYINGLKLSLIMILILLLLGIIFNNIKVSRIIYYLIMSVSITFGSMIGINKKTILE